MRKILAVILVLGSLPTAWAQPVGVYQHGTVVRMRMGDCLPGHRGFISNIGGAQVQMTADICPEYTLVSDKVVFVIVGTSTNQLVPLADVIDFRIHKGDLFVRLDDAKHEGRFNIKEMTLRGEWDLLKHMVDQLSAPPRGTEAVLTTRDRN